MEKLTQNIQDSFLNTARKEKLPVTLFLLSGVKLTGRIRSFDKYCLVLETGTQEQMIFKHAVSTIGLQRAALRELGELRHPAANQVTTPKPDTAAAAGASTPSDH
ncbi:MAG TPA: RNA chaperone Hfq [Terriglobales bacterium]|nr:RNA chaperone Hfq [Terriglobales bacterium]